MPGEYLTIEASKELGIPYTMLDEMPLWIRELAIDKISQERKAERIIYERALREAKSKGRSKR